MNPRARAIGAERWFVGELHAVPFEQTLDDKVASVRRLLDD